MESMYLLIPISLALVFLIGFIFWWSVRSGQFDDMEGPAYRILMDDDKAPLELKAETTLEPDRVGVEGRKKE